MVNSDEQLLSILDSLRRCEARLRECGCDDTAHLVSVANGWNERMGINRMYPTSHAQYLKLCHDAGQTRPDAITAAIRSRRL